LRYGWGLQNAQWWNESLFGGFQRVDNRNRARLAGLVLRERIDFNPAERNNVDEYIFVPVLQLLRTNNSSTVSGIVSGLLQTR
jgi:hypothetical protein